MKYITILFLALSSYILAQVPQTLNYQGVLTDASGVIVPENTYALTFKIYDAETGGNMLWQEMQTLFVSKGLFSTILGQMVTISLPFDKPYWIGITVGTGTEMTPRMPLASSPYSFISRNIIDNSIATAKIQDGAVTQSKLASGLSIPPGGNAGGDLSGTFPNPTVSKLLGRSLSTTTPTSGQVLSWNGSQWTPVTLSSGMGGSGTINYIPKFTAANTIGISGMVEESGIITIPRLNIASTSSSNSNVTILSTSSAWGELNFSDGQESYSGSVSYNHQLDYMEFYTRSPLGTGGRMRILSGGQVIVGANSITPNGTFNVASHDRKAIYATTDSLSGLTRAIYGTVLGTANVDAIAIYGSASMNPGYGIGGEFLGGYRGITSTAAGSSYSDWAVGVYGISNGTAGTRIGVYGIASGTGSSHFGVYGEASGTSSYAVYAFGNLGYSGSLIGPSDVKLKTNISPISNAVDKIKLLVPKSFEFSKDPVYARMNMPEGTHYGLIAQDIEAFFPQMVKEVSIPSLEEPDSKTTGPGINYKGINYIELIPLLIQGMKEQQALIEQLQKRIEALESR